MIRVLVVDDSEVFRRFLGTLLETDPQIRVTGTASGGREAFDLLRREASSFDVVTMDLQMPGWDGLETTRRIMGDLSFAHRHGQRRLGPGGDRPHLPGHGGGGGGDRLQAPGGGIDCRVRGGTGGPNPSRRRRPSAPPSPCAIGEPSRWSLRLPAPLRVVALGASTGGPPGGGDPAGAPARDLPPAPAAGAAHHPRASRRASRTGWTRSGPLRVRLARRGDDLIPGQVLVAPAGTHLELDPSCRVLLTQGPPRNTGCAPPPRCSSAP